MYGMLICENDSPDSRRLRFLMRMASETHTGCEQDALQEEEAMGVIGGEAKANCSLLYSSSLWTH